MDERQKAELQKYLDARERAMSLLKAQDAVKPYEPMIEGAATMSGGLSNVSKPAMSALRGLVNKMQPNASEEGLISPVAEKFTDLRRYLQKLTGSGAETEASKAAQQLAKGKSEADMINRARELQSKPRPSDAETAYTRYMMDKDAEEAMIKRLEEEAKLRSSSETTIPLKNK